MKEKKMKAKEEELNGMLGDRKTEPALRCQLTPQTHSNPPLPPLFANTSSALVGITLTDLQNISQKGIACYIALDYALVF